MNIKFLIKYNPAGLILLMVLLVGQLVWQVPVQAHSRLISAEFTPNRNNPNNRTFTDTSPLSGVCSNAHQALCKYLGLFSISTGVSRESTKRGNGVEDFGRGSAYFSLPEQRTITVTSDTGETATLNLRITGLAFRYADVGRPEDYVRSELNESRGCRIVLNNGDNQGSMLRMFIRDDGGAGGRSDCSFKMLGDKEYQFHGFDIIYELETPEPLNMKNGVYRGSSLYTMGGAGRDIDVGDGVNIADPLLYMNFVLTVNHMFALEFPPGSETAVLQPLGGWSQWTDYKKVPATLRKDQHFTVSGSTNFSVNLSCEFPMPDGRCGISNGVSTVPLDVAITMPGFLGRLDLGFAEALDYPLTQSLAHVPRFSPKDGAVFQRRSYLRFEVNGEPIKEMVTHPGSQYKGRVTVIFDADI